MKYLPSTSVVVSLLVRVHFPFSSSHLSVTGLPKLTLYTIGLVSVELRLPEIREETKSRILLLMIGVDLVLKCQILINTTRQRGFYCIVFVLLCITVWLIILSSKSLYLVYRKQIIWLWWWDCLSQCPSPLLTMSICHAQDLVLLASLTATLLCSGSLSAPACLPQIGEINREPQHQTF